MATAASGTLDAPMSLYLETWRGRDEASGSSSQKAQASPGSKFFVDLVGGCVRLGKETELFAYQEEGPTH